MRWTGEITRRQREWRTEEKEVREYGGAGSHRGEEVDEARNGASSHRGQWRCLGRGGGALPGHGGIVGSRRGEDVNEARSGPSSRWGRRRCLGRGGGVWLECGRCRGAAGVGRGRSRGVLAAHG
jgi:hypothetical protein